VVSAMDPHGSILGFLYRIKILMREMKVSRINVFLGFAHGPEF
jgi:hypothetical protein